MTPSLPRPALALLALLPALVLAADDPRGWTQHESRQTAQGLAEVLAPADLAPPKLEASVLSQNADLVTVASLIEGPTLLFYFSATCPHCLAVTPEVARLHASLPVVGIASGSNSTAELEAYRSELKVPFPLYKDFSRRFASDNLARSTPTVWIVEPRDGGFVTTQEFRPYSGGSALFVGIEQRRRKGEPIWGAFTEGTYWGPQACGGCHVQEYNSWALTHHSKAYYTLAKREKLDDAACVRCHVTGMDSGGFTLGDHGSELVDVTCEACHGPGGPHGAAGPKARPDRSREACVGCHDAEHSIAFSVEKGLPHIDHFRAAPMSEEAFLAARKELVEGRAPKPLLAFPEGENLGPAACRSCHEAEHKAWSKGPHATAFTALKKKGSHNDPACLRCHGEPLVDEPAAATDWTHDGVGCESCHGPGEKHVATEGAPGTIVHLGENCPECVLESICTTCHNAEQDPGWQLEQRLSKIKHGS